MTHPCSAQKCCRVRMTSWKFLTVCPIGGAESTKGPWGIQAAGGSPRSKRGRLACGSWIVGVDIDVVGVGVVDLDVNGDVEVEVEVEVVASRPGRRRRRCQGPRPSQRPGQRV